MRSPAEARAVPLREWLERLAHLIALALVVLLLVDSLRQRSAGAEVAERPSLAGALARWSTVRAPAAVHVHLDGALSPVQRDWLAALRGAGTAVSWWGDELPAVAAVASPIADPAGATAVWTAVPADSSVVLSDAMGALDSARGTGSGVRFVALSAPAAVSVRAGSLTARSAVRDSLALGRLLVLGGVGWESKFVVASLEERGWKVDARLALSPRGDVVQGDATPLDTAHYAAVIALDTTALRIASEIERYVRSGGGLVMEGQVAAAPRLDALRPGKLAPLIVPSSPFDSVPEEPRRALGLRPIVSDSTAVVVERRDSLVTVASRRVDRGRVIVVGYEESWRWRLGGGGNALDEYREWWSAIVASVAHVTRSPLEIHAVVDEAPLVSLVDKLGPGAAAPPARPSRAGLPAGWILGVLATLLLVEWTSRRLRGVP